MWSVGCVLGEAVRGRPLFIADCSLNHMLEVIKVLGTPSKKEVLEMNPDYEIEDYDLPHVPPTPLQEVLPPPRRSFQPRTLSSSTSSPSSSSSPRSPVSPPRKPSPIPISTNCAKRTLL